MENLESKAAVDAATINKWVESVQKLVGARGKVAKEEACECLITLDIAFSAKRPVPIKLFQQLYGEDFNLDWVNELVSNAKRDKNDIIHILSSCECFTVTDGSGTHTEYYICDPGRCWGPYPWCAS